MVDVDFFEDGKSDLQTSQTQQVRKNSQFVSTGNFNREVSSNFFSSLLLRFGLIKNESQASFIALFLAVVCFIVAGYVLHRSNVISLKPDLPAASSPAGV